MRSDPAASGSTPVLRRYLKGVHNRSENDPDVQRLDGLVPPDTCNEGSGLWVSSNLVTRPLACSPRIKNPQSCKNSEDGTSGLVAE